MLEGKIRQNSKGFPRLSFLLNVSKYRMNKAQTSSKRIRNDRHRAIIVRYSERRESIMQKHFLGRERKHCCVKWDHFEGIPSLSFSHSIVG